VTIAKYTSHEHHNGHGGVGGARGSTSAVVTELSQTGMAPSPVRDPAGCSRVAVYGGEPGPCCRPRLEFSEACVQAIMPIAAMVAMNMLSWAVPLARLHDFESTRNSSLSWGGYSVR